MRFRTWFLAGGCALIGVALLASDPDGGAMTALFGLGLVTPLLAVAFAHLARKALHDYPEADMRPLFRKAAEHPIGAGLALVALSITASALLGLFGKAAHAAVPPQAQPHLLTLAGEIDRHWPSVPMREYFGGLIEHESCITLSHPRCWAPTSRLKTAREEGAGLGQLTRAFRPDGSLRFDALADMRARHPALRELDWATIYQRPDLQLRAVVLKVRTDYLSLLAVADPMQRLAMSDLAYNAGLGRVHQDRRACQIKPGCDPQRWWGHVETTCTASRQPIYGARSACDISRHHVRDVLTVRAPKYRGLV